MKNNLPSSYVNDYARRDNEKLDRFQIFINKYKITSALYLGCVHTKQRIGDQSEIDEEHEYYVELIESRKDSTIAL